MQAAASGRCRRTGTPFHEMSRLQGMERVHVIVERHARDLIERARPIGPSERILDLGCRTGIVARLLRDRLGGAAWITAVDSDAALLAVARRIAPEVDWRDGDPTALPFRDSAFDLVFCQQISALGADRRAVLCEVRRVLAPGGRVIVSDRAALRALLVETGFVDVRSEAAPSSTHVATARAPAAARPRTP